MFPMKRLTPALVAALALAACKETVSPEAVDTGTMADQVATMSSTFDNNAAFQNMSVLSLFFPQYGGVSLVQRTLPQSPSRLFALRSWRERTTRAVARAQPSPTDIQALFPVDVLGKTFEWNVTNDVYEMTARAGADPDGIRIIIYSVNSFSGMPVEPVQELGYLDLVDESTASADQLGVVLRLASTTIADYAIAAVNATTSQTLTAVGYITGGTGQGRVDFDLLLFDDFNTGGGDFEYSLSAQAGGEVVLDFHDNGNGTGTGLIRVSSGGNTIEITTTETLTGSTGQVKFNGTVVANMTQSGDDPAVFVGTNGRELTQEQQQELGEVVLGVLTLVLSALFGILAPAIVVF
jgi:hypothetical protein